MAACHEFRFRKQTKAAINIQAHWRGYRAVSYYKKLKWATVVTQCSWRGRVARKELRKLKMATRETGALQQAKDKLEKQVEELTWRLQLENLNRWKTDLEEEKGQEIVKLQNSLQAMQSKVDEANALVIKEREAAQKVFEEASSIVKETPVPVEDTEKIESLTAEVESLKGYLDVLLHVMLVATVGHYGRSITYRKKILKKASETKKKTTELTISHEGLQKKIGRKLEDASDSLIMSQSLGKRIYLELEIVRHTSPTRKVNHSGSSSNVKQKNDFVKGGEKLATESSARETSFFDPPLKQTAVLATHIIPNATPLSDTNTVMIKATYTENVIIKFQLSLSARVADLEEKVIKRLKLKEGSFKCKYKDNDGDLVLIACDEDLQNCIGSSSSLDKNIIKLLILPRINLAS